MKITLFQTPIEDTAWTGMMFLSYLNVEHHLIQFSTNLLLFSKIFVLIKSEISNPKIFILPAVEYRFHWKFEKSYLKGRNINSDSKLADSKML